jgi:hypothetical protein
VLPESRIYHLLGDQDSFVSPEISRITNKLFVSNDRNLINLHLKVLHILDELVDSPNHKIGHMGIEKALQISVERSRGSLL